MSYPFLETLPLGDQKNTGINGVSPHVADCVVSSSNTLILPANQEVNWKKTAVSICIEVCSFF